MNKFPLLAIVIANVAIFFAVIGNHSLREMDLKATAATLRSALPGTLVLALLAIINAQFSPEAKARIVFLRWKNALPGCEAFTRHARRDSRVNLRAIEESFGPLPTSPSKQNAFWYRLYRTVDEDPAVLSVHREFLFARDYTCIALMALFVLGSASFLQTPTRGPAIVYISGLLIQFLAAGQAARNLGRRFVTTVLALKSVGR